MNPNRYRSIHATFALICCALSAGPAEGQQRYKVADLEALQRAFVNLADEVRPSVTAIRTYAGKNRPFSQGSGFVVDADGHIGTNFHVIDGADRIDVLLLDGSRHKARVVSTDRRRDLAVLKIKRTGLKPVAFGDTSKLRPNMWTFACGNPFGLANENGNTSISYGTISALGRDMTAPLVENSLVEYYGNLIETTSTINPGNSGGPLFNIDGEMIGVVTAIETSSGVNEGAGFAIPMNGDTLRILDTLKSGRQMRYGFLGVEVQEVAVSIPRRVASSFRGRGALISEISPPDGPAARAGLRRNDVVLSVNGEEVGSPDELVRLIQFKSVGSEVEISYMRNNLKRKASVTLADRETLMGR